MLSISEILGTPHHRLRVEESGLMSLTSINYPPHFGVRRGAAQSPESSLDRITVGVWLLIILHTLCEAQCCPVSGKLA